MLYHLREAGKLCCLSQGHLIPRRSLKALGRNLYDVSEQERFSCTLVLFHDLCEALGALPEQEKHEFAVRRKDFVYVSIIVTPTPWASYLILQHLDFFFCVVGIKVSTLSILHLGVN